METAVISGKPYKRGTEAQAEDKEYTICIAGGGSRYTPGILKMLVSEKDRFPLKKVILFDNEYDRQHRVAEYARILMREYYPSCKIVDTVDPKEAFTGIDFAMMQIRAGRMKMREKDEHIALAHGCIGQETCGAGGFAYGMRSIPAVCEIIREVRKYSPNAWVLNYSNPAAIVAEATKRIFPGDFRVINICDMPVGIMAIYAKALRKSPQIWKHGILVLTTSVGSMRYLIKRQGRTICRAFAKYSLNLSLMMETTALTIAGQKRSALCTRW